VSEPRLNPEDKNAALHLHAMAVEAALAAVDGRLAGLSEAEAAERLKRHGPNRLPEPPQRNRVVRFLSHFHNVLIYVLLGAAVITASLGHWIDTGVILAVVIANSIIGYIQEGRAEQAMDAIRQMLAPKSSVLRDGKRRSIDSASVVPGDIILLEAGEKVPADLRLTEVKGLRIDEAILTGESVPVEKGTKPVSSAAVAGERSSMAFSGTLVAGGAGRGVVMATGAATQIGRISGMLSKVERLSTPLVSQMNAFARWLTILILLIAAVLLVYGYFIGHLPFAELFMAVVGLSVAAIPEGLPAVLTITLAVGVQAMARRNAIVRRLPAIETLGSVSVICSDKTGTLTTNQMTVQEIVLGDVRVNVTGAGFEPHGRFEIDDDPVDPRLYEDLRAALWIGALCNNARLVQHYHDSSYIWEVRGDPTEGALVVAAAKGGYPREQLTAHFGRVDEIPFSSQSKYMATFHRMPQGDVWALVKGAPEVILKMCSRQCERGRKRALGTEDREEIQEINSAMARRALRVLGLGYHTISPDEVESFKARLQGGASEMTFAGLVGMIDPPRLEVPDAVQRCRNAGIRVIMATGDHRLTGEAIAREVGILDDTGQVLTGSDLEQLSDEALDEEVESTAVFARVTPEHKYRIVESLRRRGHIVAMTGDGVNDAPALQAAEIGVAMGITGTDVTKETAEMVLTDDNFASIVNAVEEGRGVFQNVRKVVKFLLATNIGEDLTLLSALAFLPGAGLIITPVQILWVNLVTDGLLDITIALEPNEGDVMDEPPRRPGTRIVDGEILRNIVYVALFMTVGTLGAFVYLNGNGEPLRAQTVAFTTLAMFQVFNALNCRSRYKSVFQLGFFTNKYLVGAMGLSVLLQVAANRIPFMEAALGTVPLSLRDWAAIILISSSIFVADETRKAFARRSKGRR